MRGTTGASSSRTVPRNQSGAERLVTSASRRRWVQRRLNYDATLVLVQTLFGWVSNSECVLNALETERALATQS
jgi:uncharacterized protein with von Willebrand factor type A (vWA) domain